MSTLQTAIDILSLDGIGKLFDPPISAQAVHKWKSSGVPAERCPAIERATGGKVVCEDLRADVDWAVLRGTASADVANKEMAA